MSSVQRARDGALAVPQDDGGESRALRPARRSPPASHASAFEAAAEWRPLGWAGPLFPRRARAEHTVEQSLARRLRRPVAVDVDNRGSWWSARAAWPRRPRPPYSTSVLPGWIALRQAAR